MYQPAGARVCDDHHSVAYSPALSNPAPALTIWNEPKLNIAANANAIILFFIIILLCYISFLLNILAPYRIIAMQNSLFNIVALICYTDS